LPDPDQALGKNMAALNSTVISKKSAASVLKDMLEAQTSKTFPDSTPMPGVQGVESGLAGIIRR